MIDKGLLSNKQAFFDCIDENTQILIISNSTVASLYLETVKNTLSDKEVFHYILEDGEQYKNIDEYQNIIKYMLDNELRRNAIIIALGGGVIGDLAGYVAATYNRGIKFIQVPTTLLAQVDSSVGGKTAINVPQGKNLIGAFHQPVRVITDLDVLKSLPRREYLSGVAEIIKAAILWDATFFSWLEDNVEAIIAQNPTVLTDMIYRACCIKAQVVAEDEKEQGIRAWLNLGHTFGHAIERELGYGVLLHGEAVAIGICLAAELNYSLGKLTKKDKARICQLIAHFGLPVEIPDNLTAKQLVQSMVLDKKNISEKLTLILPTQIGKVTIDTSLDRSSVLQFLNQRAK